jgi:hypothetical protein
MSVHFFTYVIVIMPDDGGYKEHKNVLEHK